MNFFQRDSVLVGIVVSVFFSITMFYCLHTINSMLIGRPFGGASFQGVTERFVSTLAVFFNIIPFVIYLRTRKDLSMKGVGIVTVLLALFVLVFYYIL
ncbi:MAG: hypothetical protein H6548_02075 [Chitinophagales bacterium]|nr:hypothetical protein [Chitinophagales bacterium]HAE14905.1 hypothetical protein [Bacteroidota bacterium]MCB9020880.1 hypothetical protein [Chitinophagales bacterium]HAE35315.1 hypothetical protein [Bacteroidota bacterium]HPR28723.1 hypothetical protein [Chitinophagales bacterium]